MPWVTRHLRVGVLLVLLLLLAAFPLRAGAAATPTLNLATAPKIIFTELQTTGKSSSEEFIELYNLTDADINLADTAHAGAQPWKVQFFSAAATSSGMPDWTKPAATVTLSGTVPAHGYYVLASSGYAPGGIDSDQSYNSRLSDSGGGVQLITASATATTFYDRLLWKQAVSGQTLPGGVLATPVASSSLQRLPNDDGEYISSGQKLTDFTLAAEVSPKDMWRQPVVLSTPEAPKIPVTPDPPVPSADSPAPEVPAVLDNTGLAAPQISELLPNPAAPLSDAHDEFIELFNPNSAPFNLAGYTLETGVGTLHEFIFGEGMVLAPESYSAFNSSDTRLSLSNSGGQARLLDKTGATVSETATYGAAADGMSWSHDTSGGTWQWSLTATPNAANVITIPAYTKKPTSAAGVAVPAKEAAPAKVTAKKPIPKTTAKVIGTSAAKPAKPKTSKKKTAKTQTAKQAATAALGPVKTPIHTGVLVAVVASAVLYAGYEYRHDIRNRLYKLRYNRAVRAFARQ